jgi:hypothetical protein
MVEVQDVMVVMVGVKSQLAQAAAKRLAMFGPCGSAVANHHPIQE